MTLEEIISYVDERLLIRIFVGHIPGFFDVKDEVIAHYHDKGWKYVSVEWDDAGNSYFVLAK